MAGPENCNNIKILTELASREFSTWYSVVE